MTIAAIHEYSSRQQAKRRMDHVQKTSQDHQAPQSEVLKDAGSVHPCDTQPGSSSTAYPNTIPHSDLPLLDQKPASPAKASSLTPIVHEKYWIRIDRANGAPVGFCDPWHGMAAIGVIGRRLSRDHTATDLGAEQGYTISGRQRDTKVKISSMSVDVDLERTSG